VCVVIMKDVKKVYMYCTESLCIVMQLPKRHMPGRAGVCSYYVKCQKGIYVLYGNALPRYAVVEKECAGMSRCV